MSFLIATWPRRIALSVIFFFLAALLGFLWLWHVMTTAPNFFLTDTYIMNSLVILPALLSLALFGCSTALAPSTKVAAAGTPASVAATAPGPFKAQVVGVQWLNPLVWKDYPTEWSLLWTLGLAKPNKNDDMVREKPQKFSSVQPVAAIVWNMHGKVPFNNFFEGYVEEAIRPLGRRYAMNGDYFYTVQPKSPKNWRELAGIRMEFAIPDTKQLPSEQAAEIVRKAMRSEFVFYNPRLSTANIPADVHMHPGGASAGFRSLDAAMDYLQANPTKTVWVMNWDAPEFPKDEEMSENISLLVLAGPQFDTQREPLAWIGRPAQTRASDFQTKPASSRIHQAWESALNQASANAGTTLWDVGYVIHDAGKGEVMGSRIGAIAQALTTAHPELNWMAHSFNTPALLGEMRAGTAVTNMALAVAWTHQKGQPVLVAGTTGTAAGEAVAVVVTPPAKARIVNPEKDWFRARGEGNAYLMWWGLRKDRGTSRYGQGFSD